MLNIKLMQHSPMPLKVALDCAAGQLHALVGPSGSGKTTVLRSIAGLHQAESGLIECHGETWFSRAEGAKPTANIEAAKRSCGFLFQNYALFPHLTARENVAIALQNIESDQATRNTLATEWLERMSIAHLSDRLPNQLSGGQQQRVALARALARTPKILLLDEPFSAIDTPTRQSLYRILSDLRADLNIPILLVTHDLREADLLADKITVIDKGFSLQTASPLDLFRKPRNSRVAELVGINNKFHGIFTAGHLTWDQCSHTFQVPDKGKIPPNTPVAWVIPQSGLSANDSPTDSSIPVVVDAMSSIGQMAVITLRPHQFGPSIIWEASSAEVRRLQMHLGRKLHLELDARQIHIMPLRIINDPSLFTDSI